ncbi:MAG: GTPase Era [Pseudomonadota bacterium]
MSEPQTTRAGFVAVIGAPNAGKSTLVNAMVGAKVSIVTQKVQTTRARIRGIAMNGPVQTVFVDTPGIFKPRRRLDRAMVQAAWDGTEGADATLLMVDAVAYVAAEEAGAKPAALKAVDDTDAIVEALQKAGAKAVLALNKVDKVKRERLLALAQRFNETGAFTDIFMISAEKGSGVEDLRARLEALMPEGPWLYPEDQIADISERLLAAEVTREKLFLRLHEELPYASTVETERWIRTKKGDLRIEQTIYVERETQKSIVLGKGGRTVKEIGQTARQELEEMLDEKVHLFLFVKVREAWADDPARYREMGLDIVE